ncbi:hypothetical protein R1flu_002992 [Riccia fluitans]|uniref:Uncharacterized protein n=1 Tax=Riccia fluitans TaxID=41844 RepID=A0ABD1YB59_9MARC
MDQSGSEIAVVKCRGRASYVIAQSFTSAVDQFVEDRITDCRPLLRWDEMRCGVGLLLMTIFYFEFW